MIKKNFLPIAIDISESKILVIGGGSSALKKIKILLLAQAIIEVLSDSFSDEILALNVKCLQKAYEPSDLNGYFMLFACTDDEELDKQIAKDGRDAGVLVNVHDKPALCQFVSPAIYRSNNISVAVSSNGENVYETIRLRNIIQEYLENLNTNKI